MALLAGQRIFNQQKMTHLIYNMQMRKNIALIVSLILISAPTQTTLASYFSMFEPTEYTPATYVQPKYDPFDPNYSATPKVAEDQANAKPIADFNIFNGGNFQSNDVGTTDTLFTFDANASYDVETDYSRLEARWDFENDGDPDSYFSVIKNIKHKFQYPGTYRVKLEILDRAGNISAAYKDITIAQNTAPIPAFSYSPVSGTNSQIFTFNTSLSTSNQFRASTLVYRFDWDGNGWDTKYEAKTLWNHKFDSAGSHKVTMEVKDPGGYTARISREINTVENTAPLASFTVYKGGMGNYDFDAQKTADAETAHNRLYYRWDFDYNGQNDIVYNTFASSVDHASYAYRTGGHKVIRLEVTDADGAKSYAYAEIDVPWTAVMQNFMRAF